MGGRGQENVIYDGRGKTKQTRFTGPRLYAGERTRHVHGYVCVWLELRVVFMVKQT